MPPEIIREIFQRALQRLYRTRRESTERVSRSKKFCLERERIEITTGAFPLFHREQNLFRPIQAAPTGCAPAARFLREEVLEVPDHADRTGMVIQHNHSSRTQP